MRREWLIGAAVLAVLGLVWYSAHEHGRASEFQRQAYEFKGQAVTFKAEAVQHDGEAKLWKARAEEALASRDRALSKLAASPKPPASVPPPASDVDLTEGLKAKGILTPLPRIEGMQVWSWSEDALRVPALETRLDAAEKVITEDAKAITALKGEAEALEAARDRWKDAHNAQEQRADALEGQVQAMTKAARADRVKWWLKVGGAAAAGYLAGRAMK